MQTFKCTSAGLKVRRCVTAKSVAGARAHLTSAPRLQMAMLKRDITTTKDMHKVDKAWVEK